MMDVAVSEWIVIVILVGIVSVESPMLVDSEMGSETVRELKRSRGDLNLPNFYDRKAM